MTARVSTDGALGGLQALVLENELLRAVVLPELGGKLWQLTGLRTGQPLPRRRRVGWTSRSGFPLLGAHELMFDDLGQRIELGRIRYRGDRYRFRALLQD